MKYWEPIPFLYCLGAIFDPRIKLAGLENGFDNLCENLQTEVYANQIGEVKNSLFEVYFQYENRYGNPQRGETSREAASEETNEDFYSWGALNRLKRTQIRSTTSSSKAPPTTTTNVLSSMQSQSNELQQYLATPKMLPVDPQ